MIWIFLLLSQIWFENIWPSNFIIIFFFYLICSILIYLYIDLIWFDKLNKILKIDLILKIMSSSLCYYFHWKLTLIWLDLFREITISNLICSTLANKSNFLQQKYIYGDICPGSKGPDLLVLSKLNMINTVRKQWTTCPSIC